MTSKKYKQKYNLLYKELYSGYEKCCKIIDSCVCDVVIGDRHGNLKVYVKNSLDVVENRKEQALNFCELWLEMMHYKIGVDRYDSFISRTKMKLTGELKLFIPIAQLLVAMSNKFREDFDEESSKFNVAPKKKIGF
jgi:hypothetical protein